MITIVEPGFLLMGLDGRDYPRLKIAAHTWHILDVDSWQVWGWRPSVGLKAGEGFWSKPPRLRVADGSPELMPRTWPHGRLRR